MACEFTLDGRACNGIVVDLSARGLFVLTTKQPAPGSDVEIRIRETSTGEIALRCRVARLRRSHGSATSVIPAGFGAEIDYAPPNFYDLLIEIGLG